MIRTLIAIGVGLVVGLGAASTAYAQEPREIPQCTSSLKTMADNLSEQYSEAPLVGVYIGGTDDAPTFMVTTFVNPDTGTWTVTQSDNFGTCIVKSTVPGEGGVVFDVMNLINPGTES